LIALARADSSTAISVADFWSARSILAPVSSLPPSAFDAAFDE
jgi:hypothetical protein